MILRDVGADLYDAGLREAGVKNFQNFFFFWKVGGCFRQDKSSEKKNTLPFYHLFSKKSGLFCLK